MVNFKTQIQRKEALDNVDFRRAFSMALDRQTIIDIAFYGSGTVNDFASGLGYAFEAWSDEATYKSTKASTLMTLKALRSYWQKRASKM